MQIQDIKKPFSKNLIQIAISLSGLVHEFVNVYLHIYESFVAVLFFYGTDVTYVLVREKMYQPDAADFCADTFDGTLAKVESADDLARVNRLLIPLFGFDKVVDPEDFDQNWVAGRTDVTAHAQVDPDTQVSSSGK